MPQSSDLIPRRGYADGPFGQIHFHDMGPGSSASGARLPLILLHQAPQNAHQFDAVFAPLAARGIRAIAIDLPGFGESDVTPFVPTVGDYAAIVVPVLDQLGIAVADVLGHHTGAMVATEAALRSPSRVRRLILNGPAPLSDSERAAFMAQMEAREKGFTFKADGTHLSETFAGRAAYSAGSVPLERVNRYIIWMLSGYGPFWYGHHAAFTYDHEAGLRALRHPTLILTNTGDMIFEQARRSMALRPDFSATVLEGGGSDIQDQQPEAWSDAVAAFLK
jgi:pimeloyl-ACP methyl ester carboxylesterase